jgi:hypothetical protein
MHGGSHPLYSLSGWLRAQESSKQGRYGRGRAGTLGYPFTYGPPVRIALRHTLKVPFPIIINIDVQSSSREYQCSQRR